LATNIDKFKKSVIGAKGTINDYTSFIVPSADFKQITNFSVILTSWNNILVTPIGSYDHDPEYGSNLHKYVFEPLDNQTADEIKNEVRRCLNSYTSQAEINSINIIFLGAGKGFSVNIIATYKDEQGELNINIDEASSFNII